MEINDTRFAARGQPAAAVADRLRRVRPAAAAADRCGRAGGEEREELLAL